MAPWLRIPNWERFQHYKDRNPPWIKLHRSLLDDYAFAELADAKKGHLILIWLFAASQAGGRIPNDATFLSRKLGTTELIDLDALIHAGFLVTEQNACEALAGSKHDASNALALARSRETESEAESEKKNASSPAGDLLACPVEEIIDLYHEAMAMNPRCKVLNQSRRGAIKARWLEASRLTCKPFGYSTRADGLAAWRVFFDTCAESLFLTGRAAAQPGKPPFVADIDFLMSPSGFAKCLENKYHREAA
jgi:hypothetical protein